MNDFSSWRCWSEDLRLQNGHKAVMQQPDHLSPLILQIESDNAEIADLLDLKALLLHSCEVQPGLRHIQNGRYIVGADQMACSCG